MLLPGALEAEVLNRAAKVARGEGPPPETFVKSMYRRTHFKPF